MIKTRIYGGLGNQIFQLAASLLIREKNRQLIELNSHSAKYYKRPHKIELHNFFNLDQEEIEVVSSNNLILDSRITRLMAFKSIRTPFISDSNLNQYLKNYSNFNFQSLFIDGYFQHNITQEIFEDMKKSLLKIKKQSTHERTNAALIHVRGTDFIDLDWNRVVSKDYYSNAMLYFIKKYNIKKFNVITDDIEFAKSQIAPPEESIRLTFSAGTIAEDFFKIESHQYRILSSSTFALWASELGNNANGKVIAPAFWIPGIPRKILLTNEIKDFENNVC